MLSINVQVKKFAHFCIDWVRWSGLRWGRAKDSAKKRRKILRQIHKRKQDTDNTDKRVITNVLKVNRANEITIYHAMKLQSFPYPVTVTKWQTWYLELCTIQLYTLARKNAAACEYREYDQR